MVKILGFVVILAATFAGGIFFQTAVSDSAAEKAEAVELQIKTLESEIANLLTKKGVLEKSLPALREAASFEEAMK